MEAPELGDEGWDVLEALEEPLEREVAALAELFCASQPRSAHSANNQSRLSLSTVSLICKVTSNSNHSMIL